MSVAGPDIAAVVRKTKALRKTTKERAVIRGGNLTIHFRISANQLQAS